MAAVATQEMVDISLSALRMGAREVDIVCLERRDEMPAALEEIEEAEAEGIILHPRVGAKTHCGQRRQGDWRSKPADHARLRRERAVQSRLLRWDSESQIECDTIILAIGQAPRLDFLTPEDRVADLSARTDLAQHENPDDLGAGSLCRAAIAVFGPRLIIDSVGDGKRAAIGIDEYLRGRKHRRSGDRSRSPRSPQDVRWTSWTSGAQPIPMLPLERRTGVTEVEIGYDEQPPMAEAHRCLHCWVNTVFEGNDRTARSAFCAAAAWMFAPRIVLQLVPLERIEFTPEVLQQIRDNQECFRVELDDVAADELGVITGSAMLKDETRCIRCGLCAERCPVGTITMEAYNIVPGEADGLIPADSVDGILRTHVPAAGITIRNNMDEKDTKPESNELNRRSFLLNSASARWHCGSGHGGVRLSVFVARTCSTSLRRLSTRASRKAIRGDSSRRIQRRHLHRSRRGRFFCAVSRCTHLGCLTAWKPELGIIACPCHGSKFTSSEAAQAGDKIEGPAPRRCPG